MFRTQEVVAGRRARTGFGIVLVAGALVMFARGLVGVTFGTTPSAALIMTLTWLAAFATYGILVRRPAAVELSTPNARLKSSLVWPTIGILLMLPLLVHLPFGLLIGGVDGYDEWVAFSYMFTVATTLTAGLLGTLRALQLAEGRQPTGVLRPGAIYGLSLLLGCIPFGVFLIPPILIAITGIPFIFLFAYQETLVARERDIAAVPEIPDAIARFRAVA